MNTTDYIWCETCQSYVDFWKYDGIEDAGHADCKWRYVTDEELQGCVRDCEDEGCLNEITLTGRRWKP